MTAPRMLLEAFLRGLYRGLWREPERPRLRLVAGLRATQRDERQPTRPAIPVVKFSAPDRVSGDLNASKSLLASSRIHPLVRRNGVLLPLRVVRP